ncbi:chemotaxis response regulator protein-glutamate methylesterase [Clostridium thailandense]|uniref:Protein-glutamate methylesterase/protein-glutamine glutaminase n=1 Tax=Clostridium thailandense TaxID=2794346 RepID=A0A949X481_9CLOT|nr:chemotaxis response regulator protein-glutamate methylesterase [Clostridium thailandense]MBV7273573.1 chemotaxis response regulator protein-glutamate methylesterase [Clostridium thailandense]
MKTRKKVTVLIIDDSLLFRETLARAIGQDLGIEVVGTASDPFDARDKIIELQPDVLTLDVEMPKMNGIEFLKRLMPQYPLPVVVVSAVSSNVFDALKAGAVDFVTKPEAKNPSSMNTFFNELIVKIKIASTAQISLMKNYYNSQQINTDIRNRRGDPIIAIGASTGGTEAIFQIIKSFPRNMPGIVVTQHMPPKFTKMYADRLNQSCLMEVKEAENGDAVKEGRVLIAPGDFHMSIAKDKNSFYVRCIKGDKVNGHCPSVDVLFDSVAECAGKDAIGVILTGMGYDGAKGLLKMKRKNAFTIGQDEKSSVVYGMPMVAFNIGAVTKQLTLNKIPEVICSYISTKYR